MKTRVTKIIAAICVALTAMGSFALFPSSAAKEEYAKYYDEIIILVNQERAKVGAAPLKFAPIACKIAELRADENTQLYSHSRPNGSNWDSLLMQWDVDFDCAGENLARRKKEYPEPQKVVDAWMDSPAHRANMLDPDFTHIGIGIAYADGLMYYAQIFLGYDGVYEGERVVGQEPVTETTTTTLTTTTITTTTTQTATETTTTTAATETTITTAKVDPTVPIDDFILGDVNFDGAVDSSDASLVLVIYASIQTDPDYVLDEKIFKAADVDRDTVIDSSDASSILAYYAKISIGEEASF